MTETDQPADHVSRNVAAWNGWASEFVAPGERNWAADEPNWGIWGIPESEAHVLPDDLDGKDTIELGCGTGYVSAWLARRGPVRSASIVSGSSSPPRAACSGSTDLSYPLHGRRGAVPFADASFDLAISEYGACLSADPDCGSRSRPRAAPRRAADLSHQRHDHDAVRARRRGASCRATGCCATTSACIGSSGPASPKSSSTSATATGSGCCAATGSRSRTWSSCGRRPTRRRSALCGHRGSRVGAALALRRGLEGAQARLTLTSAAVSPWASGLPCRSAPARPLQVAARRALRAG